MFRFLKNLFFRSQLNQKKTYSLPVPPKYVFGVAPPPPPFPISQIQYLSLPQPVYNYVNELRQEENQINEKQKDKKSYGKNEVEIQKSKDVLLSPPSPPTPILNTSKDYQKSTILQNFNIIEEYSNPSPKTTNELKLDTNFNQKDSEKKIPVEKTVQVIGNKEPIVKETLVSIDVPGNMSKQTTVPETVIKEPTIDNKETPIVKETLVTNQDPKLSHDENTETMNNEELDETDEIDERDEIDEGKQDGNNREGKQKKEKKVFHFKNIKNPKVIPYEPFEDL